MQFWYFLYDSNQEAPVGGRSVVDIALVSELLGTEEVVVVGYSTQTRKFLPEPYRQSVLKLGKGNLI